MKLAGNVLVILLIYTVLALALVFGGIFVFDIIKDVPFNLMQALQSALDWFPSILISGLLVGCSMAFGKFMKDNPGRFSALLLSYIKVVFVLGLCCTTLCFFISEILGPMINKKLVANISLEKNYQDYLALARKYKNEEKYDSAMLYSYYALNLKSDGEEARELRDILDFAPSLKIEHTESKIGIEELKKETTGYKNIPELLQKAVDSYDEKNYFDAHYYASMVVAICKDNDANLFKAKQLAGDAWNKLYETDYSQKTEENLVYAEKRRGYSALSQGDFLEAYYLFRELIEKYPTDLDIVRYFEIAKEELEEQYFYIDETTDLQAFEQYHNVFFTVDNDFGAKDVIFAKGVTLMEKAGDLFLYLRSLSSFSYDANGNFVKSFSVPYAKVFAEPVSSFQDSFVGENNLELEDCIPCFMLEAVDRDIEGKKIVPTHIYGDKTLEQKETSNFLLLPMKYNDLILLCRASLGAENMPLGTLFEFVKICKDYGYAREVFLQILISRLVYPLFIMAIILVMGIFAWNYRLSKEIMFKFKWLFALPIFTIAVFTFLEIFDFVQTLFIYTMISLCGFGAIGIIIGFYIVLIFVLSFIFLALRGK